MSNLALEMSSITKQFPGVLALDKADFQLERGEVHALLGINGAGKSTLIKVLAGINPIDEGVIRINGKDVNISDPQSAKELGVAAVYQSPQMIPSFTGYENIFLGCESENTRFLPYIDRKKLKKKAQDVSKQFPIDLDLDKPVAELEAVERECIAILRALIQDNIKILILDEPTSILSKKEVTTLFHLIETLKNKGVSIIYITHRLGEVFQICDRYTIFRNGRHIKTLSCQENGISHNDIAEMMLNTKVSDLYPAHSTKTGAERLSVYNLTSQNLFSDISFKVHEQEVVGVFGLIGSGIDELSKALFGAIKVDSGEIRVNQQPVTLKSCSDAIQKGIFLVPGDRHTEGLVKEESIAFNATLSRLSSVSRFGLLNSGRSASEALRLMDMFELSPRDPDYAVGSLSGGNQQKVVMAKGAYTDSDVYIFAEPTAGVDVGAKALIYQRIRDLSQTKGTLMMSSDCEEIYGLSDRIIVLYKGHIVLNKRVEDVSLDEALVYGLTGGQTQ